MNYFRNWRSIALIILTVMMLQAGPAQAIELVHDGKANVQIVIPSNPLPVETYAAKELQYHVHASSGAELPIVSDDKAAAGGGHVYLGHCKAAIAAKIDPSALPGNAYFVNSAGDDLFICGNDAAVDPFDRDTHEGTLFGVYDILETNLGV